MAPRSTAQQRQQERMVIAEKLLRERDYSVKELSLALPYSLSHTRQLVRELLGRERSERKIFVSGWDIQQHTLRFSRTPRYRWITAGQANVAAPTRQECLALLASSKAATIPPLAQHDATLLALFGRAA